MPLKISMQWAKKVFVAHCFPLLLYLTVHKHCLKYQQRTLEASSTISVNTKLMKLNFTCFTYTIYTVNFTICTTLIFNILLRQPTNLTRKCWLHFDCIVVLLLLMLFWYLWMKCDYNRREFICVISINCTARSNLHVVTASSILLFCHL